MTPAARWTGLVAAFATLCAGAIGVSVDCEGAEAARAVEVVAIGPKGAWAEPLRLDCTAGSPAAAGGAPLAVLRYRDGPRCERCWRAARVRFDAASSSASLADD